MTVPNGPADIATFALSNTTDVSISANTEVNTITFTSAASSPDAITANPAFTLTLDGTGVTNNSGITPDFVIFDNYANMTPSHRIRFIEVKGGHIWDRDIVRFKGARAYWPEFQFELHQKKGSQWNRIF